MKKDIHEIYLNFDGKLVGTNKMKQYVCKTLYLMTDEIINYITSSCWFLGSMNDSFAFTFTGNDLKNQHLIFLSDELFAQDETQIIYTISHEIGHVILGHRNSVLEKQSKSEINKQEKEAYEFAENILSNKNLLRD